MARHHTQKSREEQILEVERMLVSAGGYIKLKTDDNVRPFTYLLARTLSCSFMKAREYLDIAVQAAVARRRLNWQDAPNAEDKR